METDHQFYELFRAKPEWFESLSGIKLPSGCRGRLITHKFSLQKSDPESILLDVLAPIAEPAKTLEKNASRHYRDIIGCETLSRDERELAEEIYFSFLLQRFKNKSPKQLRDMIAELAPLRETRFVKEYIKEGHDEGVKKGIEKGTREIVQRMHGSGLSVDRISEITKLTKKAVSGYLK